MIAAFRRLLGRTHFAIMIPFLSAMALPLEAAAVNLIVSKSGTGTGTVSSSPAGISCGIVCTSSYAKNTRISLTAVAASGSRFANWSGGCSGTATTLSLTLKSRSTTCTANFTLSPVTPTYSLTINRAGTGAGIVSSMPAGINCGSTCSGSFVQGTIVTLTASAAADSLFAGWSGNCSGTNNSVAITISAGATCTASFNPIPVKLSYDLIVTQTGTGGGRVTSSPAGIDCGSICSGSYLQGTLVSLTAVAAAGSSFVGWSGSCSGASTSASITMSANSTCFADFTTTTVIVPTSGTADLAWDPVVSVSLAGYRVYYGLAPGVYQQLRGQGINAGAITGISLSGLSSGKRYFFAVTAFDVSNAESLYSNEVFKDIL